MIKMTASAASVCPEIEETSYVDVDERYHWFLWPALGVILLNILLVNTRLRRVP